MKNKNMNEEFFLEHGEKRIGNRKVE